MFFLTADPPNMELLLYLVLCVLLNFVRGSIFAEVDICAAPTTKGVPIFKEDTEYEIEYISKDIIDQYDDIENEETDWPYRNNVWGFKAATITMTQTNGKKYTENILIPAIPIFMPKSDKVLSFAIPRGQYFYVFSTDSVLTYSSPEDYKAILITFIRNRIDLGNFRILTEPTKGAMDPSGKFCDTTITEGMCFGESFCCNAFEDFLISHYKLTSNKYSNCRTILLCPKGVIKIDMKPYHMDNLHATVAVFGADKKIDYMKDNTGETKLEIHGMEVFANEENFSDKNMRKILQVESNYLCPDGSYNIHLNCPMFTKSMKKANVDEKEFFDCPFCKFPDHKYQIFPPGHGGEVRGNCPDKDKMPSFGFINKGNDYLSCCIKRHKRAEKHIKGVYSMYSIEMYRKSMSGNEQYDEEEEEVLTDEDKEMSSVKTVSENKYEAKERKEARDAEQTGANKESVWNENGIVAYSITRSLIIAILMAILMIISSLYIYFK